MSEHGHLPHLCDEGMRRVEALRARHIKAWYPVHTIMGPIQAINLHLLDENGDRVHSGDLIAAGNLDHSVTIYRVIKESQAGPALTRWYEVQPVEEV
jgi:hypothetical protein